MPENSARSVSDRPVFRHAIPASDAVGWSEAVDADNGAVTVAVADRGTLATDDGLPTAALVLQPTEFVRQMLQFDVTAADWQAGGGDRPAVLRVGLLAAGTLVAMASAESPAGVLTRLRVVVAPSFRRRGYARALLRTLAVRALDEGLRPACQFPETDTAAQALATRVGFVPLDRSLA